jgi:ankyrin repeat protein
MGDLHKVTTFISEGADVNKPIVSVTALHVAAGGGHKDIVEFLIVKGANINASGRRGVRYSRLVGPDC